MPLPSKVSIASQHQRRMKIPTSSHEVCGHLSVTWGVPRLGDLCQSRSAIVSVSSGSGRGWRRLIVAITGRAGRGWSSFSPPLCQAAKKHPPPRPAPPAAAPRLTRGRSRAGERGERAGRRGLPRAVRTPISRVSGGFGRPANTGSLLTGPDTILGQWRPPAGQARAGCPPPLPSPRRPRGAVLRVAAKQCTVPKRSVTDRRQPGDP